MSKQGKRFGRLVAVEETGRTTLHGDKEWLCQCDCGNTTVVWSGNLRENGGTRSCGCLKQNDKASLERAFADKIHARSGGLIEYVSGYEKQDHCTITVRCSRCGHVFTRDKNNIYSKLRCAECAKERRFADRFSERYGHAFKYISGYEGNRSTVLIECRQCGARFFRRADKVFEKNTCCYNCWNNRRGYEQSVCEMCSELFMRFAEHQHLCPACHESIDAEKKKQRHKTNRRLREARARDNGKVDYSITLGKLIMRDDCICQLCGTEVDESDYTYIGNTFVAGNMYPSIDHIKPLSKGGTHQWDNVHLAHRLCNSIKRDS